MTQYNRFESHNPHGSRFSQASWISAFAIGVLALLVVACGSSEPATQAVTDTAPAAASEPAEEQASAARPEVAVVPISAPETGSDEEKILGVLETQIRAVNAGDYGIYQDTCYAVTRTPTVAAAERFIEDLGMLGEGDSSGASQFSPRGYNARNVEVKFLRQPQFAQTKFDVYNFDVLVRSTNRSWEKVDGEWYSQTAPCFSF